MRTIDPATPAKTGPRPTQERPEVRAVVPGTGVLGTILTELDFGEDERDALGDLSQWVARDLDRIVATAAGRARVVALASEDGRRVRLLDPEPEARPSIRSLRRHAARQWLLATLGGVYDTDFSRRLRHTWLPILLAEQYETRATPALVAAFLDYLEGYIGAQVVDVVADNIVPYHRMLHALRTALDVQRRIFGVERTA